MVNLGVLASGTGSNFQALVEADLGPGQIVVLISNVPDAPVLDRARSANIPAVTIDHRAFSDRQGFEGRVLCVLEEHRVEWVILAGFMRILTSRFIESVGGRVVNIHPALCPAFPGVDAQRQALEAGVKLTGCTVHLVDAGVDTGPILAQAAVPILPNDDVPALKARILEEEHLLLPAVIRAIAEGRLRRDGRGRATLESIDLPGSMALWSPIPRPRPGAKPRSGGLKTETS